MLLSLAKAMRLRRDVCSWHVAELFLSLRCINRGSREIQCEKVNKKRTQGCVRLVRHNSYLWLPLSSAKFCLFAL